VQQEHRFAVGRTTLVHVEGQAPRCDLHVTTPSLSNR
jgi:hypothetical protein